MKIKKLAALALTCAMVVGGGAMFAACGDEKDPGGDTNGFVEDTRIWYAVGKDSKGTLKDQGWDQNNSTSEPSIPSRCCMPTWRAQGTSVSSAVSL